MHLAVDKVHKPRILLGQFVHEVNHINWLLSGRWSSWPSLRDATNGSVTYSWCSSCLNFSKPRTISIHYILVNIAKHWQGMKKNQWRNELATWSDRFPTSFVSYSNFSDSNCIVMALRCGYYATEIICQSVSPFWCVLCRCWSWEISLALVQSAYCMVKISLHVQDYVHTTMLGEVRVWTCKEISVRCTGDLYWILNDNVYDTSVWRQAVSSWSNAPARPKKLNSVYN